MIWKREKERGKQKSFVSSVGKLTAMWTIKKQDASKNRKLHTFQMGFLLNLQYKINQS